MGVSTWDGPLYSYGGMGALSASYGEATPDPNSDASPSMLYQGIGVPDVRYPFLKDRVQGFTGMVPGFLQTPDILTIDTIPITASTTNLAGTQAGTTVNLVMATTSVSGVTVGIPIQPQSAATPASFGLNPGTPITTALILDYGFAFGNVTSGSKSVTVADSTMFFVGMPIIIADVGAASAGTALLTWVTGITSATVITINDAPLRSANPTPIGTGNIWGNPEIGPAYPTAHMPYMAGGPGLFWDPRQGLARNVQATAAANATAVTMTVTGYDMYWQLQTEAITLSAGATVQGVKTWKAIVSAKLDSADAGHNYSLGTGDVIGLPLRADRWETLQFTYASKNTVDNVGFTAAVTSTATPTTGDVRGTLAVASLTTIGAATNGSISALALTGRRLTVYQHPHILRPTPAAPQWMFGVTPA